MAQLQTKFLADSAVTNAKLANMATLTLKGNNTGGSTAPLDLSTAQVQTMLSIPTSSAPLPLNAGGTGISAGSANAAFNALSPMTTLGDIIYGGAAGIGTRLAIGTTGQVLTVSGGGIPSWSAAATGTVTSVALTVPAFLSVAGSPITSSGTLAVTFSGTALPIANGGTGQTTASAAFGALSPLTTKGDLLGYSTLNARVPVGTNGQVLTADSTNALGVSWQTNSSLQPAEARITLSPTDITNQYVDLAVSIFGSSASANSATLWAVGGPMQLKTVDYTVSLTGGTAGVTRITFAGDLATGGPAELISGDILVINYSF